VYWNQITPASAAPDVRVSSQRDRWPSSAGAANGERPDGTSTALRQHGNGQAKPHWHRTRTTHHSRPGAAPAGGPSPLLAFWWYDRQASGYKASWRLAPCRRRAGDGSATRRGAKIVSRLLRALQFGNLFPRSLAVRGDASPGGTKS
jgi:hypothetical protein